MLDHAANVVVAHPQSCFISSPYQSIHAPTHHIFKYLRLDSEAFGSSGVMVDHPNSIELVITSFPSNVFQNATIAVPCPVRRL